MITNLEINNISSLDVLASDYTLNELTAQLLNYVYEAREDLNRVIVMRADGQPSLFDPCRFASQTTELVNKAMKVCENSFRVQLLTLVTGYDLPADYSDLVAFCEPYKRQITLSAIVALQEHERAA